jgi:hypothetical protein
LGKEEEEGRRGWERGGRAAFWVEAMDREVQRSAPHIATYIRDTRTSGLGKTLTPVKLLAILVDVLTA